MTILAQYTPHTHGVSFFPPTSLCALPAAFTRPDSSLSCAHPTASSTLLSTRAHSSAVVRVLYPPLHWPDPVLGRRFFHYDHRLPSILQYYHTLPNTPNANRAHSYALVRATPRQHLHAITACRPDTLASFSRCSTAFPKPHARTRQTSIMLSTMQSRSLFPC